MNHLYYSDNLNILAQCIHDELLDFIYLEPPVNSKIGNLVDSVLRRLL